MSSICKKLLEGWQDLPDDQQRAVAWFVVAMQRVQDPETPEGERRLLLARLKEIQ
jgi:hypothetical protein